MTYELGKATDGQNVGRGERAVEPALLDVHAVAGLLGCSSRHVYRMSDAGIMPGPVKLGSLVRWSRAAILDWIEQGCPSCRKGVRHG